MFHLHAYYTICNGFPVLMNIPVKKKNKTIGLGSYYVPSCGGKKVVGGFIASQAHGSHYQGTISKIT